VLEVKTDPEIPLLPPHSRCSTHNISTMALAKGDPDEASVIAGTARQVLETILRGND
jgi:pyruvate dehydrogenase (quinone)